MSVRPERVYRERADGGAVDYFYWSMDLYKPEDYEPLELAEVGGGVVVYTRLHWTGIVVWSSPKLFDGGLRVFFAPGVHTVHPNRVFIYQIISYRIRHG